MVATRTPQAARDLLDLITRDREKAAAALGVPLAVLRSPATTQDAAPIRHPHGGNETLDLQSFTNDLNQTAQSLTKLRLFFVRHLTTSSASSISVGNSGANALIIKGCFGATAASLAPGAEIVIVEGLANLEALKQDLVLFCAAPLKIEAGDGSPCRAFAIEGDVVAMFRDAH